MTSKHLTNDAASNNELSDQALLEVFGGHAEHDSDGDAGEGVDAAEVAADGGHAPSVFAVAAAIVDHFDGNNGDYHDRFHEAVEHAHEGVHALVEGAAEIAVAAVEALPHGPVAAGINLLHKLHQRGGC